MAVSEPALGEKTSHLHPGENAARRGRGTTGKEGREASQKEKGKEDEEGQKAEATTPIENQEEENVADKAVLWSVVQNEIYSDGSIKVRRMSGHEFQEVSEVKKLSTGDGSWERKFAFDYGQEAPGRLAVVGPQHGGRLLQDELFPAPMPASSGRGTHLRLSISQPSTL